MQCVSEWGGRRGKSAPYTMERPDGQNPRVPWWERRGWFHLRTVDADRAANACTCPIVTVPEDTWLDRKHVCEAPFKHTHTSPPSHVTKINKTHHWVLFITPLIISLYMYIRPRAWIDCDELKRECWMLKIQFWESKRSEEEEHSISNTAIKPAGNTTTVIDRRHFISRAVNA